MNDLSEMLFNKKKNKEKIFIFSFTDILNLKIILEKIDILRFDLNEFALLYGYKDTKRVKHTDFLPLLRNVSFLLKEKSKFLAVDVPFYIVGSEEYDNSFENIVDFYVNSFADFLVIDYNYVVKDFIKKLAQIKIPIIINFINTSFTKEKKIFYNEILELDSFGIAGIILEDFDNDFVVELKKSLSIPIICNNLDTRSDGFYGKFTSLFGFDPNANKKYLNYIELLKESFNDCIKEIKSENI